MSSGVTIKAIHNTLGYIVSCETKTGEIYRGKLGETEDYMNCQMTGITVTYTDGQVGSLDYVFIPRSKIRFLILPEMLKNTPMYKNLGALGNPGAGRGKSVILQVQAAQGQGSGGPQSGRPAGQQDRSNTTAVIFSYFWFIFHFIIIPIYFLS